MEIILIITTLLMACVVTIGWVFVSLRGPSPIPGGSQPLRRFPPPPCPPPKKSIEPLDGENDCEFCRPPKDCPGELRIGPGRVYLCTRKRGHGGPHVARAGSFGHDLKRWSGKCKPTVKSHGKSAIWPLTTIMWRLQRWAAGDPRGSEMTARIAELEDENSRLKTENDMLVKLARLHQEASRRTGQKKGKAVADAVDEWISAKARLEAGVGTEMAARLSVDSALDAVSAKARATTEPQACIALILAGFRLARDTYYAEGRNGLDMTLENIKRDLEHSACSCKGDGEIVEGHPGDPASAVPCPNCREEAP